MTKLKSEFAIASVFFLILSSTIANARGSFAGPSSFSGGGVSEWEHQASVGAIEITPIFTVVSDKYTPAANSSTFSAAQKTGNQYSLRAEYGWLESLSVGVEGKYANDSVSLTPASSSNTKIVKTSGFVGINAFVKGNADFSSGNFTYGLDVKSVNGEEVLTSTGTNASRTGYEISPYLGIEFKLNGAILGAQVQYLVLGDQTLANELVSPVTNQTFKGGNEIKATVFYEESFSSLKLGGALTYTNAAATQISSASTTNNDQSTAIGAAVYAPIYFAEMASFLPVARYTSRSYSNTAAALKSNTDFSLDAAIRLQF